MQLLKQSTSATVKAGPFVDDSDGKTAETGLTIAQADIRLSKNGGDFAQTNNASGATHDENGYYGIPLDATDTGTLGRLTLTVSESGALPIRHEYMVLPANTYDSLVGTDTLQADVTQVEGTAVSTTTAQLGVNVVQISEDATAADNLEAAADGTGYDLGGIDVSELNGIVDDLINGGRLDLLVDAIKAKTDNLPADPAATSDVTALNDLSAAEVNAQCDTAISDYDPPTKTELDNAIAGLNDPTAASVADAVWDEAKSGHTSAGSFGEEVQAHSLSSEISALNDVSAADVNAQCDTAITDAGLSAADIADQVWDEALSGHTGAGSAGEALSTAGSGSSASDIADAVWDEALSGHTTSGTAGAKLTSAASGSTGSGDTAVDHDTGGTDALRVVDSDGNGVDDVTIRAYLTTDYESSTYTVQGTTYTGTDGRWVAPLYLDVGVYTLVFEADDFVINTTTVTVS
jgi:hypothetical protein